jgi:predicted ABC-type transport system involved in lysophospholipase L1 biosynthesis ATPase subunit
MPNSSAATNLNTPTAIEAEGLTKRFGDFTAVEALDLHVETGTVVSLLGPNGAGKTTMVRMLATLLRPDGGRARIAGQNVVGEAQQVRRVISLTGQFAALDKNLTAAENLQLMARLRGHGRGPAKDITKKLIERFDVEEFGDRLVKNLSGGPAPPRRPRRGVDRQAAVARARRADHGPRPAQPPGRVVEDPRARRGRRDAAANDAVSGRGRCAGRQGRADRPRPRDRRGHPGAAEGPGGRAARGCGGGRRRDAGAPGGSARGALRDRGCERAAHDLDSRPGGARRPGAGDRGDQRAGNRGSRRDRVAPPDARRRVPRADRPSGSKRRSEHYGAAGTTTTGAPSSTGSSAVSKTGDGRRSTWGIKATNASSVSRKEMRGVR